MKDKKLSDLVKEEVGDWKCPKCGLTEFSVKVSRDLEIDLRTEEIKDDLYGHHITLRINCLNCAEMWEADYVRHPKGLVKTWNMPKGEENADPSPSYSFSELTLPNSVKFEIDAKEVRKIWDNTT